MANAGHDDNRNVTLLVQSSAVSSTNLNLTATPIAGVNPLNIAIVDGSGVQITSFGGVSSSAPSNSSVSVTTSNTTVSSSNTNQKGLTIYNESGAIAYIKLGSTASTSSYSIQIAIGGYYEVPFGYTGNIDGITSSGTAILRVTSLV